MNLLILLVFAIFPISLAYAQESPQEYQIGVSLVNIGEIDKKIGTYEMDFWYSISSDTTDLTVNPPPRVDFINGRILETRSEFTNQQIIEQRMLGKFTSEMNFRDFPFEKIPLQIKIEPLPQWPTSKAKFTVHGASGIDQSATVPGWQIIESSFTVLESKYGQNTYSQFVAEYVIQRDIIGSFLKTIFPILIILGISFVAYIIPKNYDIVTELSLLPLLALVFFHVSALDQLPPLGYMTIFDKILIIAYALIMNNIVASGRQIRADEFSGKERAWHLNNFHLKLSIVIVGVLAAVLFLAL
jgi:hypothetical protein